jgi:hypothetical protein
MLTCFISLHIASCNILEGLGMQKLRRMSVTDTLFGRWGLAVADDVTLEMEAIFVRRLAILISMPHDSKILFMKDLSRCKKKFK